MFVALEPPEEVRAELAAWRDGVVAGRDDLRPVPATSLHLTLVFLGWQDESAAPIIAEAVRSAAGDTGPARLAPKGVQPVPPRGPRLFALDLEDEAGRCGELQAAVSGALAAGRFYRPEKRPFWPHMTLARVKRGRHAGTLEAANLPGAFEAGRVTLYRSTLRPQGAVYDALAQLDLRG